MSLGSVRKPGPPPKVLGQGVQRYLVELHDWLYRMWESWANGVPPGFGGASGGTSGTTGSDGLPRDVDGDPPDPGVVQDGWASNSYKHKLGIVTTKGDLLGFSTLPDRVPVGTDGQVLTADSAEALGVKYTTSSADEALALAFL